MEFNYICDTSVKVGLLQEFLQSHFGTDSKLIQCDGTVISKGMGFTSEVIRVELLWEPANEKLPSKAIVKAPSTNCLKLIMEQLTIMDNNNNDQKKPDIATMEKMIQLIHKAEYDAYTVLQIPETPPVPIPRIYGMRESDPSVIVLEDLGEKSAMIKNIAQGLSIDQWNSISDMLADLHGWSLTTKVPWRKYVRGCETVMVVFKDFIDSSEQNLKTTLAKYGNQLGKIDVELFKKEVNMNRMFANYEYYRKVLPDVMQHGDTWINNIMFEKDPQTGEAGSKIAAFIDWQICFEGCGLNDLARLTSWCVDPQIRIDHEDAVLERYYNRLKKICLAGNVNLDADFSNVKKAYRHACAINSLMGINMIDFMIDFVAKVQEDPTGWRRERMIYRTKYGYEQAEQFFKNFNYEL